MAVMQKSLLTDWNNCADCADCGVKLDHENKRGANSPRWARASNRAAGKPTGLRVVCATCERDIQLQRYDTSPYGISVDEGPGRAISVELQKRVQKMGPLPTVVFNGVAAGRERREKQITAFSVAKEMTRIFSHLPEVSNESIDVTERYGPSGITSAMGRLVGALALLDAAERGEDVLMSSEKAVVSYLSTGRVGTRYRGQYGYRFFAPGRRSEIRCVLLVGIDELALRQALVVADRDPVGAVDRLLEAAQSVVHQGVSQDLVQVDEVPWRSTHAEKEIIAANGLLFVPIPVAVDQDGVSGAVEAEQR